MHYRGQGQPALRDVTFELSRGERVALLGASGCGKTTLCRVLLGALPPGTRVEGSIDRHAVRMAYVPQETAESLHPMLQVGTVLREVARVNGGHAAAVDECLRAVGLPDAAVQRAYPHELSGGQRQRVILAQALLCEPELLIADEPTSALDSVLESAMLRLILDVVEARRMGLLLVTHNPLLCVGMDRVVVMLDGRVIEEATPEGLFRHPEHPYTVKLIEALPPTLGEPPSAASGKGLETV
ncbi:MAG: ATP-binding cassette domain-containing protein [Bryobacteraceae bacterium]